MRKTKRELNYQTLGEITDIISSARDMIEVAPRVVETLSRTMGLKGAALLLLNKKTGELENGASFGLSQRYLDKGPISSAKSIADSLRDGPVAIHNVEEDPRLQYPREAVIEGIKSILSVPIILRGKPLGVIRLYTEEEWEFHNQDLVFAQAVASIIALVLDNMRMTHAYKTSIDALKGLRSQGNEARA